MSSHDAPDCPPRCVENAETGCWEWSGDKTRAGYGRVRLDGKTYYAHRLAYTTFNGTIPFGRVVMHTCDNPPCVNPLHLSLGTASQNQLDSLYKGRCASAKLAPDDVRDIRARIASGETGADLAKEYGVGRSTIYAIKSRKKWKYVE